MAMRRGGTGARQGKTTHSPMPGVREKGPPPGSAARPARACVVPHTGPSSPELTRPGSGTGAERSSSRTWMDTERGTETGLIGCREAVITNAARLRAPADHLCKRGDRETCMVKPRGGEARVNGAAHRAIWERFQKRTAPKARSSLGRKHPRRAFTAGKDCKPKLLLHCENVN